MPVNLFTRLHKWASRQDENYVTEALAVVLQTLLEKRHAAGLRLIHAISGGFLTIDPEDESVVEIDTQVETEGGRPDLQIRLPTRLVVVEVKVESELRPGQLEGYREWLRTCGIPHGRLVLLTKYPVDFGPAAERPDYAIRWYEIADVIAEAVATGGENDPVCQYLCDQLLEFLRRRNMALAAVNWQLKEGSLSLRNFMVMLQEAARAKRLATRLYMNLDFAGYYLDGKRYWFGLWLDEPHKLQFGTRERIDVDKARRLGVGEVEENSDEPDVPGRARWWRVADLESPEVHFYSLSKVDQILWLERFLDECLSSAKQVETQDESVNPSE
jgi:hypothetical protein